MNFKVALPLPSPRVHVLNNSLPLNMARPVSRMDFTLRARLCYMTKVQEFCKMYLRFHISRLWVSRMGDHPGGVWPHWALKRSRALPAVRDSAAGLEVVGCCCVKMARGEGYVSKDLRATTSSCWEQLRGPQSYQHEEMSSASSLRGLHMDMSMTEPPDKDRTRWYWFQPCDQWAEDPAKTCQTPDP